MVSLPTGPKNHNSGNKNVQWRNTSKAKPVTFDELNNFQDWAVVILTCVNDTNDKRFITNVLVL